MKKKQKLLKRILSLVLAINLIIANVCCDGIFPFVGLFQTTLNVKAYTPTLGEDASTFTANANGEISINSIAELKDYAYHYHNSETFADNHEDDKLKLVLNASDVTIDPEYIPLGTTAHPFNGSLLFSTTNNKFDLNSSMTIFDYITDDAVIGGNVTLNLINQSQDHVLLANHVVHRNNTAVWKLMLDATSVSHAGVIGEMQADTIISLDFKDESNAPVSNSSGDAGLICGTMQTGAKIVLSLTKSNSSIVVSSNGAGNAGAFVGTMYQNALLELVKIPVASAQSTVTALGTGYAGGLVGWNYNASVSVASSGSMTVGDTTGVTIIPVQGNVIASSGGAGGLYGYYKNDHTSEFDLKHYHISASVYAKYCGGVFGVLESNKGTSETAVDFKILNTGALGTVNFSSGEGSSYDNDGYFGGVVGKYATDNLENSLILDGFSVSAVANADFASFGGVIGLVDPSAGAYIKADDLTVTSTNPGRKDSATFYGGLIGKTSDTHGVFVDLGGFTLTASNFKGGGVVGSFKNGILRFGGITNMSASKAAKGGQLIGENDNVLVYALGDGTDGSASVRNSETGAIMTPASGWTYIRSDGAQFDDLGTWGEVVRLTDIEDITNGILTNDSTNHTVTVKAAVTSMGTQADFSVTALNIQLNQGADYDCLKFTAGDENKRNTLLGGTLTLTDNISLSGTGINGFMRDGGEAIGEFTGTLNGDGKTISFAIGEVYGQDSNGANISSMSDAEGLGQIYAHPYNGLFSFIGNGTSGTGIANALTIDGNINVHNKIDGMNIGGVAAVSKGNTTLNGIIANQTIKYKETSAVSGSEGKGKNIGGLIGLAANGSDNGTVAITGVSTINTTLNISGYYNSWNSFGSAIGKVTSPKFVINIAQNEGDKLTVAASMVDSGFTAGGNTDSGGLIGRIISAGTYSDRKVNIKNLEYDGCIIVNKATTNGGGFLGYSWLTTDTTIEGLTVKNGTITNSTPNVGVMCYEATGKWTINNLSVEKMSLSNGAGTSLGMLVNIAYNGIDGLYLNVLKSGYTLTDKSGDTGISLPGSIGIYDEVVAYSASDVLGGGNGAGVVSINMNDDRNGTKVKVTETGTYQNQLTSASSSVLTSTKYANGKSRYYYNLDKMSNSVGGQNLVLWSVSKYSAGNISAEFKNTTQHPFGTTLDKTLSGTADLTGLSFYPLKSAGAYTLDGLSLTFDYNGIYTTAEEVDNTDSFRRDPGATSTSKNQHYLMHSGLFIDNPAGNTITISGATSIGGNFLEVGDYKAALISGTMKGNLKVTGSLEFVGLTPKTTSGLDYSNGYLLIHKISRPDDQVQTITMELKDISTSGYSSTDQVAVAKSLVGPADGKSLTFKFSGIKLDARKAIVEDTTVSNVNATLTATYGTSRSIFSNATLLESINTDQYAELIYNYTRDKDWGSDGNGSRAVTYGSEITNSKEYEGKEKKYYGEPRNFTRPDADSNVEYAFSDTVFLPYVGTAYDPDANHTGKYYREIKVNVVTEVTWEGCGTYNDPYIIADGAQLETLSKFLQSGNTDDIGKIILPIYDSNKFGGIEKNVSGSRWCTDKTGFSYHVLYENNGTSGFKAEDLAAWPALDAQYYLTGAYYKITTNIELGDDFMGLGGTNANTAFRGVIVGEKDEFGSPRYTITNNTDKPFIWVTNGCVIKDIIVKVNSNVSLSQANNSYDKAYFGYDYKTDVNVCRFYGGMIGEIMGGDNIIDNSYIEFENGKTITLNGTSGTIVPVGGYVGVVVFGGLIFKNIDARKTTLERTGLNAIYTGNTYNLADEKNQEAWAAIYVNPLVGRVINGYAVNETGGAATDDLGEEIKRFSTSEDDSYHDDAKTKKSGAVIHTLKNGKKHYTVADLNPELAKLDVKRVASANDDGIIDIPNAQAMFVLSLITQSAAGTAPTANANGEGSTHTDVTVETSRTEDAEGNVTINQTRTITDIDAVLSNYVNSLSYGINSSVCGMSHNAEYNAVGTDDPVEGVSDYVDFVSYDTALNTAIPYIIMQYTVGGTNHTESSSTEDPVEVPKTREATRQVEQVTHYSLGDVFTPDEFSDLDGQILVIRGIYQRGTEDYLKDTSGDPGDRRNAVLACDVDINNAAEIHFEKQSNGQYYLWCGSETNKQYLQITPIVKTASIKDYNPNNRGNLELGSTPFPFNVTFYPQNSSTWLDNNKSYYWTISGSVTVNGSTKIMYINYDNTRSYYCGYVQGQGAPGANNFDEGNRLRLYHTEATITKMVDETYDVPYTETTITTIERNTSSFSYPARCVTSTAGYYDINLTGNGIYQLPDSFRGLGCVGNNNMAYELKIDKFDGKGCIIEEDIYLNKFQEDNYFDVIHSVTTQETNSGSVFDVNREQTHHGVGLFDSVKTSGASSSITNFILKGSINTEIFSNTYSKSSQERTVYGNEKARFIAVGGVCGSTNDTATNLIFEQINLNSLSISGSCVIGGLLGYSNNQNGNASEPISVIVNKCSATDLSLKLNSTSALSSIEQSRNAMGGFIGKCVEGNVQIKGDVANRSNVVIKSFGYETLEGTTDHRAVAGGLVGFAGNGCTVSDMNVSPTLGYAVEIGSDYTGYAGGLVGLMQPSTSGGISCIAYFKNCTVEKINVNGHYAGGFYGGKWFGNNNAYVPYSITLDNCEMRGNSTANNTIKGNSLRNVNGYAGGFLGCGNVYKDGSPNIEIKDCLVSYYTITSSVGTNGSKGYVGGFIGYTGSSENNSSIVCYIHDSSVENCTIGDGDNYAGGTIGQVTRRNGGSTKNKILGYNIKLANVTLNSTNKGAWIGWVEDNDNSTSIQFTGVGIYGNGFDQNVGNRSSFSNASFVFADYDGTCESYDKTNNPISGLNCDNYSSTSTTHVEMLKDPYVNVNPQSDLGSTERISSDGAVRVENVVSGYSTYTSAYTMAAKLYADIETGTESRRYTTFVDDPIADGKTLKEYLKQSVDDAGDRISTWKNEMGEMPSKNVADFAMIVIANEDPAETTALINRYIQLVTNTATDYSMTSSYYTVEPFACVFNSVSGNFEIVEGLQKSITYTPAATATNAFAVNRAGADSLTANKFTLLDVQFKDPLHTDKIAYHLYVPVYVKRSISATFASTALSGTKAQASDYISNLTTTHRLIENLDNWVTVYVRYQYAQDEVNAILSSGMLDWNSSKQVKLVFGTNATGTSLPNGTQLVLIDPNGNVDEAYYAKGSSLNDKASSATEFQFLLSDFNTKLDGSGSRFAEQHFENLLNEYNVTVTENVGSGYYNQVESTDDYTIQIGDNFYAYVPDQSGRYDLTAKQALTEDYYISMLVPSDNNIYLFDVMAPKALSGKMATYLSITNTTPHAAILLGDLFEQNVTASVDPDEEVITDGNRTITINVTSTVKLKATAANVREYYADYLGSTPLYHADVVTFTRHDANGSDITINGGTVITSSGSVDNSPVTTTHSREGSYIVVKTGDIRSQVVQDAGSQNYDGATITQTITVTFQNYEDEFPTRPVGQETNGVNATVSTNISYDDAGLMYSGKKKSHEDLKRYYVIKANNATVKYEANDERDTYDTVGNSSFNNSRLGNNGLDRTNTCTYTGAGMPINATAVYNASKVSNYDAADTIVYTLKLYKKTDKIENGSISKVSYEPVNIDTYLKNVRVFGGGDTPLTKTASSTDLEYIYTEAKENANEDEKMFTIGTYFEVKTGDEFHDYANYKVVLEVHLLSEAGAIISNSVARDHIVYTNAKIWPEVIQLSDP